MSFVHSWLWKQNGGQCDWASRSNESGGPVITGSKLQVGEQLNTIVERFNHYSAGIDFSRQNLTSIDVRF